VFGDQSGPNSPATREDSSKDPLLSVSSLSVSFEYSGRTVVAVQDASFDINRGSVVGLVGESGSGKSVTSLGILRLLRCPPARVTSGSAVFKGEDLMKASVPTLRALRGDRISMIFQSPSGALNPTMSIEHQIGETVLAHRDVSRAEVKARVIQLLDLVGIPSPTQRMKAYPHELSGGMKQRVLIAIAVALEPDLLVADEPTTALDMTIQAQVLNLLDELRKRIGMAVLFITHDLALASSFCDEVVVMYAGLVMERARTSELFSRPSHPYTRALLASRPAGNHTEKRVTSIPGQPPTLHDVSRECPFAPRCPLVTPECLTALPQLREVESGHWVRCIRA
jgi:oligopeptide/dipeptide ABC transporter ATP-binding protein